MEDYYSILGCSIDSSLDEIKQRYRALARLCHPDSIRADVTSKCEEDFSRVSHAYKVLSDSLTRREYDIRWHQMKLVQDHPIHDTIHLSDMDSDEMGEYSYPCRCGDTFELSELDVFIRNTYAFCSSCSLCIEIIYPTSKKS
ncbi:DPH4 homolog [Watersipora subatra]|uniref:DPH4 homolog n=1 Tax=Watersipora subatra TaxID=2589382 RepID=UPI00355BC300